MDSNQLPSFEIPKSAENAPSAKNIEVDPNLALEGTHEILPAPVSLQPKVGMPNTVVGSSAQSTSQPAIQMSAPTVSDDSHVIADDVDVMEKEWVERAKKIITLTSNDPYVEAQELGKLKATYMKKRFNKEIPLSDGKA